MKIKKLFTTVLAVIVACQAFLSFPVRAADTASSTATSDVFFDDFDGDTLDTDKWLIAYKSWGGNNGGVVPENVSVSDGTLKLEGHGNYYTGDIESYNGLTEGGVRTGAAIATREYYSSGSYEVVAKVAPELGACSAMWTFEYEEYYPGDPEYIASGATGQYTTVNHEIDIEIPTANGNHSTPSFEAGRFNTYTAENRHNSNFEDLPYTVNDGKYHTYRFDWHTGDTDEEKRVDFYVDDIFICSSTEQVPTNASRFWIAIWFPCSVDSDGDHVCDTGWTGTANFDTTVFEIDSVKITPYHEAGDTVGKESFPYDGWAVDSFPELIEAECYNHLTNGDFSSGEDGWTLGGSAAVSNGAALLTSGKDTDTISQDINVYQRMTYTISADIVTDGTEVTLGARKQNGSGNTSMTYTTSGHKEFSFVTPTATSIMNIYAQVTRYQDGNSVTVDNLVVKSGSVTGSDTETPAPTPTPDPEPTPAPEPVTPSELIVNGSFDAGEDGWNLSGSAAVSDGVAVLASGKDTDTISQSIAVEGGKTYTLTAAVKSTGAVVNIGVQDYNGRYTTLSTDADSDGMISLTFTVASHIKTIQVYAEVLRYQDNSEAVTVDQISLKEGEASTTEPDPTPTPDPVAPTPEPSTPETAIENLITNGDFSADADSWSLSGSAKITNGAAVLTSGKDTDTISQQLTLEKNTTYTLSCNVETDGCVVDVMIKNHDGKYSETLVSVSESGTAELAFTTGTVVSDAKAVIRVLRYQSSGAQAVVDNVVLTKN